MIERYRRQLDFADGLIAEEVGELWEDWMRQVDPVLTDAQLLDTVYQALARRWPNSRTRGRKSTPAEVVLRLLLLKHTSSGRAGRCRSNACADGYRISSEASFSTRVVSDTLRMVDRLYQARRKRRPHSLCSCEVHRSDQACRNAGASYQYQCVAGERIAAPPELSCQFREDVLQDAR